MWFCFVSPTTNYEYTIYPTAKEAVDNAMRDITMKVNMKLSQRLQASREAAPFIIDEIKKLEAEIERLEETLSNGWLKAIDDALVVHDIGLLNPEASYEEARKQLNLLLCVNQDIGEAFARQDLNRNG